MVCAKFLLLTALSFAVHCSASEQVTRALRPNALSYPGSTPEIVSPFESVTALLAQIKQCICNLRLASATCCEEINSRLEIIQVFDQSCCEQTQSRLDVIESAIDSLSECATIAIAAPATITVSGSYCLQNDSTGTITISASNVALNLNNHALGTLAIGAVSNVHVANGFVEGGTGITVSGATNVELAYLQINNVTANGISIDTGSTVVAVHDVIIDNPVANGINLNAVSQITIKNVLITNAQTRGITVGAGGAGEVVVEDSSVYNAAGIGFNLTDSSKIINCVAAYNGSYGIRLIAPLSTSSMYAQDCVTMNNTGAGLRIEGGTSTVVNVVAMNNTSEGFFVTSTALVTLESCTAEANTTDGFNFDLNNSNGLVRGCSAANNGGYGFNDQGGTNNMIYVNNIASNNNGAGASNNYNVAAATTPFYSQSYTAVQTGTASNYWRNLAAPTTP